MASQTELLLDLSSDGKRTECWVYRKVVNVHDLPCLLSSTDRISDHKSVMKRGREGKDCVEIVC